MFPYPGIEVFHVNEDTSVWPHGRDFPAGDHVLHSFFGSPDVYGRLLHSEQPGLD
jgi:hypothetical protein